MCVYFKGPFGLGPIAALFILLITLQLLLKAKKRVVVNMTNNFTIEILMDITSHLAALSGSALVTAAMAP